MKGKTILVTGGLGYIGSHTVVELLSDGFTVIIVDNLSNSEKFILDRIEEISGIRPLFYENDLCDISAVQKIFQSHHIDLVIHFAAYKSVGESVAEPLKYFQNNLCSLMNVLGAMQQNNVTKLIFSSSATVYGQPELLPATEQTPFQKLCPRMAAQNRLVKKFWKKYVLTDTSIMFHCAILILLAHMNPH